MEWDDLREVGLILWNSIISFFNWKKELKSIKKQNKILYSTAKKYGFPREINNIKKVREKASKKGSNSSSDYSDSNSSLASESSRYTYRRPAGHKEMKLLDHVVTNNLNNNKDQSNESINSEP